MDNENLDIVYLKNFLGFLNSEENIKPDTYNNATRHLAYLEDYVANLEDRIKQLMEKK